MRRTVIVTIETSGDNAWNTLDEAESDLFDYCTDLGNSYADCEISVDLPVEPFSQTLIDKLCNPLK
jgi:hypothetical protein